MKRRRVRPSSQKNENMKKVRGKTTITENMFMVHGSWCMVHGSRFMVYGSVLLLVVVHGLSLIIITIITIVIIVIIIYYYLLSSLFSVDYFLL